MGLVAAWIVVSSAAVGGARSALAAQNNWDLDQLRSAIRDSRERVVTYEREQRGLLETLQAIDRSTQALRRNIASVKRRADEAGATLSRVESELEEIRRKQDATQRAMAARAVALYQAGELGPVALLFSADSIQDLLTRVRTLQRLLAHDGELIDRHRAESAALLDAETRAHEALETRDEALAALSERSSELEAERRTKRRLLGRLQGDRTRERSALVELEIAAKALEETLASLEGTHEVQPQPIRTPFESLRSRLPAPVVAPISKRFGRVVDAEFHTQTFHKGVEFDAPMGAPVRAVAAGQVRLAGWFSGYGKIVIVDHGDEYFSVLGHLDEIRVEVGDNVDSGDVLGTVGDTGSLRGASLYFEIRHGGEPQDPAQWLAANRSRASR